MTVNTKKGSEEMSRKGSTTKEEMPKSSSQVNKTNQQRKPDTSSSRKMR